MVSQVFLYPFVFVRYQSLACSNTITGNSLLTCFVNDTNFSYIQPIVQNCAEL